MKGGRSGYVQYDKGRPDRTSNQPRHVMDVEPAHQLSPVGFNGVDAQVQLVGNRVGRAAFSDQRG